MLEPDLAFVVDGPEGVAGYVLGALDTTSFERAPGRRLVPGAAAACCRPGPGPVELAGQRLGAPRHPPSRTSTIPDALAAYPSHGHIDLLPQARGRGIGRRCMAFLERRLAAAGSTGLVLGVDPRNTKAQRFYAAVGYERVSTPDSADDGVHGKASRGVKKRFAGRRMPPCFGGPAITFEAPDARGRSPRYRFWNRLSQQEMTGAAELLRRHLPLRMLSVLRA